MNYVKTFGLMALMTALLAGIAGYFGGGSWAVGALVFAAIFNVGSYWFSDRAVMKMYGAREVDRSEEPELYDMVDELRQRAGLPMPTVAVAGKDQPNAFATGRNPENAVVCVTEGLLSLCDRGVMGRDELRGILAHELAHIQNRDMLIMTLAATMSAAIIMLSRFGLFFGGGRDRGGAIGAIAMMILGPLAAMLIQMAISRAGEFRADRAGAEIAGDPNGLAGALQAMERAAERQPMEVNQAAAHLCIVNPLRGDLASGLAKLFSTHPPTEERVRRLREMAAPGA